MTKRQTVANAYLLGDRIVRYGRNDWIHLTSFGLDDMDWFSVLMKGKLQRFTY